MQYLLALVASWSFLHSCNIVTATGPLTSTKVVSHCIPVISRISDALDFGDESASAKTSRNSSL